MRRGMVVLAILAAFILLTSPLLPTARADALPHLAFVSLLVTPVDTNHDGLYDELDANSVVTVSVAGNFRFQVSTCLGDASTGYAQAVANTDVLLGVGQQNVTAVLPSALMTRVCPARGPYYVLVDVEPITTSGAFWVFDAAMGLTLPTNVTMDRFAPAYARVSGPLTDSAVDTDGDGLYDFLVVHVPLQVLARGRVAVQGTLQPISTAGWGPRIWFNRFVQSVAELSRVLDPGNYVWDVAFPGAIVSGLGASPGWNVTVTLTLDDLRPSVVWDREWTIWHRTAAYLPSSFVPPALSIGPGNPAWINASSTSAIAELGVPVRVARTGDYAVGGNVGLGGAFVMQPQEILHLTEGAHTVPLDMSKAALWYAGAGDLRAGLWVAPVNGSADVTAYWSGDLGPWSPGGFAVPPEVNVTVTSNMPPDRGVPIVLAADPSTKLLVAASYPSGVPQLSLYPGAFDLAAAGDPSLGLFAGRVTVDTSTATIPITLTPARPAATNVSVRMDAWNVTTIRAEYDDGWLSSLDRMYADAYGDFDGNVTVQELVQFEDFVRRYGPAATPIALSVDNVTLGPSATWIAAAQGAGSVASAEPLRYSLESLYADPYAPTAGSAHRIELEMPYTDVWQDYSVRVHLFDAATPRSVSLASFQPEVDGAGFLFAPNATLQAPGPNAWVILPGTRPANQSASNDLLFRIDATGPAYVQPHALPPSYLSPSPQQDRGLVAFGLSVVVLIAGLALLVVVAERRRRPRAPKTPVP